MALPTGYLFKFSYVYDDVNGGLKPFCSTEELVVIDYPTPDFGIASVSPTNVTFVTSFTSTSLATATSHYSVNATASTTIGDFKVVRGEHKVKLRGGGNVEAEEDPPRRLGLFEIYGILLVRQKWQLASGKWQNGQLVGYIFIIFIIYYKY